MNASIRLFNEKGMANVRLQQIANDIGISVGNLAYHFRNKEAIIDAINEEASTAISEILSAYRIFPNLIDFDNQLEKYFQFLQTYPFYFVDLLELERQFPFKKSSHKDNISKMMSQIHKRFDFNQQRGIIKPESQVGVYKRVATAIWVLISFWKPQNLVRGTLDQAKQKRNFKEIIWNQVYPYLSEKGVAEFQQLILPILEQTSSDNS
ncbi:MAG: TetR/AcrR family transcriptional regulator [Bacteroidota bacterium]